MKKIVWLVVSGLMVLSLVLASCAPATPTVPATPTTPTTPATPTTPTTPTTPAAPTAEVPKYGGTMIVGIEGGREQGGFDEALGAWIHRTHSLNLIYEDLTEGDWAKGPAGTNQMGYAISMFPPPNIIKGAIAESWEFPDPATLVIHVRKGIHFQDKPPVNGRELTADDVAYTINRSWSSTKWRTSSFGVFWTNYFASVTATDKWTVVVKFKGATFMDVYEDLVGATKIIPREMVEKYGNLSDWKNACGTGPFMLTDYIVGSSFTFARHPNYWDKNPVGPGKGNQLPYLQGIKWLIIPDASTRIAALRTAKIDWEGGKYEQISWEEAKTLIKTAPKLKYLEYDFCRVDCVEFQNQRKPFTDKRVRQALIMAVNLKEIADTYYGGHASMFAWPIPTTPEFADMYVPLSSMPQATQEIYQYHPDKAKQLLAEAGYPNGFKTHVIALAADVDLLSMVKAYWAKIGVDLEIRVKEAAAMASYQDTGDFDMLIHPATSSRPTSWDRLDPRFFSMVNDPRVEEVKAWNLTHYFDETGKRQRTKDLVPYVTEQAFFLAMPGVNMFTFWWPWVKNYNGEYQVGHWKYQNFVKWVWYDQDLKKSMGY